MNIGIYMENYIAGGVDTVILNKINAWPCKSDTFVLMVNKEHQGLDRILRKRIKAKYTYHDLPVLSQIPIYEKYSKYIPVLILKILFLFGRYFLSLYNLLRLTPYFKNKKIDAIFFHNGGYPGVDSARIGVLSARLAGIKKVFMVVHNVAVPPKKILYIPEYFFDLLVDKYARVICVSGLSRDSLYKVRRFKQDMLVIYNGVEVSQPGKLDPEKDEIARLKDSFILITASSFRKEKGHEDVFKALSMIRDRHPQDFERFKCLIFGIGTAADIAWLEQLIIQYGMQNTAVMCGFKTNVIDYFGISDLLLVPSTDFESFPMCILEAMSLKMPVIASRVGGIAEMLAGGEGGILINPGKPEELYAGVYQLFRSSEECRVLGEKGYSRFINCFQAGKMAEQYHSLLL